MLITPLYIAVACLLGLANAVPVRLCVPESGIGPCQEMLEENVLTSSNVECVTGPDRYGCLELLESKAADVMWATAEDVFMARQLYDLQVQLLAEIRERDRAADPWRYQGVAVVRRSTITSLQDLRGSKSCHTGYARTAGWNIPFSHLLEKKLIQPQCETESTVVEHNMRATSAFFGQACIPGKWTPDNETDFKLKQQYSNLCALCGLPDMCGREDPHAGYEGALTCLVDGNADVAWSKLSAVQEFFRGRSEVVQSDYGLLCPDGRVLDLATSPKQCSWASRPWNGWLVRSANENKKTILSALTTLVNTASPSQSDVVHPWGKPVLGISKPSVIHPRSPPVSPRDYLKEHKYDTTIEYLGCPETPIKLCVESKFSMEKCEALKEAFWSRRIRPALSCVSPTTSEGCLGMVASGMAHIMTADGGDVFRAYRDHKLIPVVSERYGLQDASYFAVAVVRADSGINSLSQLKGRKSCHTGIGRTAGWKIPVVTLLEAGLLKDNDCDFAGQIGHFFNSSCVPGAKDPKYDPKGTNPQSLCDLCIGNNVNGDPGRHEGKCSRTPIEAFSGYTGAFRCLVQGGGDVAFIKHTTVRDNTNGNNNASWAADLRAVDYKLLCRNTGSADVVDYNTCHLARVPAHKVLIDPRLSEVMKEEVRILLLVASEKFPQGQDVIRMFGTFKGRPDLIFKDSATALVNVRMDTFHASLEEAYYQTLFKMDSCKDSGTTLPFIDDGAGAVSFTPINLLLCVALAWFIAH